MSNKDILTFTTPETRWLSNMAYVDIEYDGIIYPSTENFYQAMKYDKNDVFCSDGHYRVITVRQYIADMLKPTESKKFSRNNTMTNSFFDERKLEIMEYAQRKKFNQSPFKSKLLETGDCHIEEGNWWKDKFWGVDIKTREGGNHLGKIIMKIRSELNV